MLVSVKENRLRVRKDIHPRPHSKLVRLAVSMSMRGFAEVSGSEMGIAEQIRGGLSHDRQGL